jgi:hypothetical protein
MSPAPGRSVIEIGAEATCYKVGACILPLVQLAIIGCLGAIAYFAFSYSRRAEQNRVWVGLAEAAHGWAPLQQPEPGWRYYSESERFETEAHRGGAGQGYPAKLPRKSIPAWFQQHRLSTRCAQGREPLRVTENASATTGCRR